MLLAKGAVVLNTLIVRFGDILGCPDDHGILTGVFGVMISRALTMMMLVMKSSGTTPTSLLLSQLLYLGTHAHRGAAGIGQGNEGPRSMTHPLG
jgi:hypothetical protein